MTAFTQRQVVRALESGRAPLSAGAHDGRQLAHIDKMIEALENKAVPMTRRQAKALTEVLDLAIENSCSCDCNGRGYLDHDFGCWVHMHRESLRIVDAMLGNVMEGTP